MNAKYVLPVLMALCLVFTAGLFVGSNSNYSAEDAINYKATVCAKVIKSTGDVIDLGCQHNLLVDQGKDYILELMSGIDQVGATPGTDYAKYISLSTNSTAPDASWTVIPDEITSGGLTRAEGTCTRNAVGNWTCSNTFTATTSFTGVQLTGLNWNGTAGAHSLVAAAQFSAVNLEANDQLQIKWTITVS